MDATKKIILVVEDNLIAAMMIKNMLEKFGCIVERVDDGDKAVALVKQKHYDGISMDIGLPTMSGVNACIAIRAYEAQNHLDPVPIIAVTSNNSSEETKQYMDAGMQHVMDKPITPEKAKLFLSFCKQSASLDG